jgi:hypothetical protein
VSDGGVGPLRTEQDGALPSDLRLESPPSRNLTDQAVHLALVVRPQTPAQRAEPRPAVLAADVEDIDALIDPAL